MIRRLSSRGRRGALCERSIAVAAGLVLDRVVPEPPDRAHPVARFGRLMTNVEDRVWSDARTRGVIHAAVGVTVAAGTGVAIGSTTAATAVCVAGRELRRVAGTVANELRTGDLPAARERLRALVGRDTTELDESGIAAAVIESLAENTVDAVFGIVVWALAFGAPGATGYRAINTMDAMVGHRTDRYDRYGWASARLDDAANLIPARLYAALLAVTAPRRATNILTSVRRDARRHPSPNAGVAEAAMAAALGVELGGPLRYGPRTEDRPRLGTGRRPTTADIDTAIDLTSRVEVALITALVAVHLGTRRHELLGRSR